ncbi:MAG: zf-HC2 domain-containing protein [candidate division KSB1 bacterium]|nr:zf-HC2 domain-containing protein [candidate division KSB1 bacterium]
MKACQELEPLLTAYVDGELVEKEIVEVEEHLQICRTCREQIDLQSSMKKLLRERYRTENTPLHVRARIRRMLFGSRPVPGFMEMLAEAFALHRFKGAFALVTLLFFVGYPYLSAVVRTGGRISGFALGRDHVELKPVEVEGEVLCVDCELLEKAHLTHTHEADHRMGIKTPDGKIWNIIPAGEGKNLLHNDKLMHKKLRVRGYAYPGGVYLNVERFQKI